MSDPVASPPSMDERMVDVGAVMDAVGSARAGIFGISEGCTLSLLFAESHPERTQAIVLYGSWARRLTGPDYPFGPSAAELEEVVSGMERAWATGEWWNAGQSRCRAPCEVAVMAILVLSSLCPAWPSSTL
jgi:pimeloyl-ACP methyl ester carboxylesterase